MVQQSNWSIAELAVYQQQRVDDTTNQNTDSSSESRSINGHQNDWSNKQRRTWLSMSPTTMGVFIGVLTGCVILAVILPLWLTSLVYKTTTTGKYFQIFLCNKFR
jgi:lipopolysaccharide/colanic/teichoic acid biosynthesis glycosyltransferase